MVIFKESFTNLIPQIIFLILFSLVHWSWQSALLFFWLGGFLGVFLLDLDHLIYVFLWRPYELNSQRFLKFFKQGQYWSAFSYLVGSHRERRQLLFHTVTFQIVLVILTFWVITSSTDFFSKGVVLALLLHTLADQAFDFRAVGDLRNWFWQFRSVPSKNFQKIYFTGLLLVFLFLSLVLI